MRPTYLLGRHARAETPGASRGAEPIFAAEPCSRPRHRRAIFRQRRSRWTAALRRNPLNRPPPTGYLQGRVEARGGKMTGRPATAQLHIAAEARVTLLARAYNAAGQQLFGQLTAAPGNIVFSPYSVATAMSMLISGARGDTASEMMRAMSMRMAADAIDAANAEMLSILSGYDQSAAPPVCPPRATANAGNCESRPGGDLMSQCQPGFRLVGNRCVAPGAT